MAKTILLGTGTVLFIIFLLSVVCTDASPRNGTCPWMFHKNSSCLREDFLCINKKCIERYLYCNGRDDCGDRSDESYCNFDYRSTPPQGMTRCKGFNKCIPEYWICDGIHDCPNGVDERDCDVTSVNGREANARTKALLWLYDQRKETPGEMWGNLVDKSAVALYSTDRNFTAWSNGTRKEIAYEISIQFLSRLSSKKLKAIPSTDLASFVNGFLVSCLDPRKFHGMDIVEELRSRVDGQNYTNPYVLLSLCNAGDAITESDKLKLIDTFWTRRRPFWTGYLIVHTIMANETENENETELVKLNYIKWVVFTCMLIYSAQYSAVSFGVMSMNDWSRLDNSSTCNFQQTKEYKEGKFTLSTTLQGFLLGTTSMGFFVSEFSHFFKMFEIISPKATIIVGVVISATSSGVLGASPLEDPYLSLILEIIKACGLGIIIKGLQNMLVEHNEERNGVLYYIYNFGTSVGALVTSLLYAVSSYTTVSLIFGAFFMAYIAVVNYQAEKIKKAARELNLNRVMDNRDVPILSVKFWFYFIMECGCAWIMNLLMILPLFLRYLKFSNTQVALIITTAYLTKIFLEMLINLITSNLEKRNIILPSTLYKGVFSIGFILVGILSPIVPSLGCNRIVISTFTVFLIAASGVITSEKQMIMELTGFHKGKRFLIRISAAFCGIILYLSTEIMDSFRVPFYATSVISAVLIVFMWVDHFKAVPVAERDIEMGETDQRRESHSENDNRGENDQGRKNQDGGSGSDSDEASTSQGVQRKVIYRHNSF